MTGTADQQQRCAAANIEAVVGAMLIADVRPVVVLRALREVVKDIEQIDTLDEAAACTAYADLLKAKVKGERRV